MNLQIDKRQWNLHNTIAFQDKTAVLLCYNVSQNRIFWLTRLGSHTSDLILPLYRLSHTTTRHRDTVWCQLNLTHIYARRK